MNEEYYYSKDGGATWVGPLSQLELNALKSSGFIDGTAIVRQQGSATQESSGPSHQENWYVTQSGREMGPYTMAELQEVVSLGLVTRGDFVRKASSQEWIPVWSVFPAMEAMQQGEGAGSHGAVNKFSIGNFFSQVFKRHSKTEVEDLLICGTSRTTPELSTLGTNWPTPWLFARVLLICLILYFGFAWGFKEFGNIRLLPGWIFVGNFAIPFCMLMLFFELNIWRNVSIAHCVKLMMLGGLLSIGISLLLFRYKADGTPPWAGPIEEAGKLLAVLLLAGSLRNGKILTGMVLGAAVGAGFAAFESAGYTFEVFFKNIEQYLSVYIAHAQGQISDQEALAVLSSQRQYDDVMVTRALLTPLCHCVWAPIVAGAYWLVQSQRVRQGKRQAEDTGLDFSILFDNNFLKWAVIAVGLHALWNYEMTTDSDESVYLKYALCGVVGWVAAIRLAAKGIDQVRQAQLLARSM